MGRVLSSPVVRQAILHGAVGEIHYARSPNGLWVSARPDQVSGEIVVSYQVRRAWNGRRLVPLDENGVERPGDPALEGETWHEVARLSLDSLLADEDGSLAGFEIVGHEFLGRLGPDTILGGLAAHLAESIAAGYGETAQDCVGEFVPLNALRFAHSRVYAVVHAEWGPLIDLVGMRVALDVDLPDCDGRLDWSACRATILAVPHDGVEVFEIGVDLGPRPHVTMAKLALQVVSGCTPAPHDDPASGILAGRE